MDSLCQGLNTCGSCCLSECKWVTFENKTESCHSTVEYLEDVVKMVDTVGNCSAPFNPPDEELIKDLSEIFGGLTGGIILTLICVFCYGYFRLTEEQRQRLGRVAAVLVRIMEFLVRLWHALRRRRGDQVPLINDAENQNVRDPAAPQQLPGIQGGAEGQDNLGLNLEDEEDVLPNHGLPFALALMDPLPLNQVVIEDEGEDGETTEEEQGPDGDENSDDGAAIRNVAEGAGGQDAAIELPQRQQQGPLFVIGAGGTNDSSEDDDEQLPPPNRSAPRRHPARNRNARVGGENESTDDDEYDEQLPPTRRSTPRRNPGRNSKSSSLRKLAQLRRNRQI